MKPTLSFSEDDDSQSQASPGSPLRRFYGVPFSWEKFPGIPKKLPIARTILLPLATPPRKRSNMNCKKKATTTSYLEKDPFFDALMECSKDEDGGAGSSSGSGKEMTRSLSDRFGFIQLYTSSSCKNGCSVSDSILHVPR